MADIFVSYATEDRDRVKTLVSALQDHGWQVWWDRELIAGPNFDDRIEAALDDARCVIVVWSTHSVTSQWVRTEANEGLTRQILVPLMIDDVKPPLAFRMAHTARLTDWPNDEGELNTVISGIEELLGAPASTTVSDKSVAVLPFDDLSPARDQEYFVHGLSEEIINALTQLADLKVAARTSTFTVARENADIATIAERLNVGHVVEGSVRKAGDRIRITAQLIEAESGYHLWSDKFDRELSDIFEIQDEIAKAIADKLQLTLLDGQRLVKEATSNKEAYEAYLRGQYLWNHLTTEGYKKGVAEFERAIDLDPAYADAHSGLAVSCLLSDVFETTTAHLDYRRNLERGLEAAQKAISLAPASGVARTGLGVGYYWVGRRQEAKQELEQAIELNPGYAMAHFWYGTTLFASGHPMDEVLPHAKRSQELDPISLSPKLLLGDALRVAGRTAESIEQIRETTRLEPSSPYVWIHLAMNLLNAGRDEEGLEAWIEWARLSNHDVPTATEAYKATIRHRETGEPQTAPPLDGDLTGLVWFYSRCGQADHATDLFAELARRRAYGPMSYFHVSFTRELLSDHPRYQALLEEAGITW